MFYKVQERNYPNCDSVPNSNARYWISKISKSFSNFKTNVAFILHYNFQSPTALKTHTISKKNFQNLSISIQFIGNFYFYVTWKAFPRLPTCYLWSAKQLNEYEKQGPQHFYLAHLYNNKMARFFQKLSFLVNSVH